MPYALRHSGSGELLAGQRVNGYRLAYYGIVSWEERPDEQARLDALLGSGRFGLAPGTKKGRNEVEWEQVLELSRWQPVLLSDHEARLANVKLRNDASLRVFFKDGRIYSEAASTGMAATPEPRTGAEAEEAEGQSRRKSGDLL